MEGLDVDRGHLVLLGVCLVTCLCLLVNQDTMIKVPRSGGEAAVRSTSGEVKGHISDRLKLKQLQKTKNKKYDPSEIEDWEPPCLPEEAPDYNPSPEFERELSQLIIIIGSMGVNDYYNDGGYYDDNYDVIEGYDDYEDEPRTNWWTEDGQGYSSPDDRYENDER